MNAPASTASAITDEQIRAAFLANGFTIKEGHTDLKPYVYDAARAVLALAAPTTQPAAKQGETREQFITGYLERSNGRLTREEYDRNYVALPCDCGDELCRGWAKVRRTAEAIVEHVDMGLAVAMAELAAVEPSPPASKRTESLRLPDGRCGLCGGEWCLCGCQGWADRQAASTKAAGGTTS